MAGSGTLALDGDFVFLLEPLLVEGEQIFERGPLEGPPQGAGLSASEMLAYPAARLFTERAAAAGHRAEISDEDAEILAEICSKLDGIALAIEPGPLIIGMAIGNTEMSSAQRVFQALRICGTTAKVVIRPAQ